MKVKKAQDQVAEALSALNEDQQRLVRSIAVAMQHPDPQHFVDCVAAAHVDEPRPLAAGEEAPVEEAAVEGEVKPDSEQAEG